MIIGSPGSLGILSQVFHFVQTVIIISSGRIFFFPFSIRSEHSSLASVVLSVSGTYSNVTDGVIQLNITRLIAVSKKEISLCKPDEMFFACLRSFYVIMHEPFLFILRAILMENNKL
jgi:hypothetical protein